MSDLQNNCPYCFNPVRPYARTGLSYSEKCSHCGKRFCRNQIGYTMRVEDRNKNYAICAVIIVISLLALFYY